MINFTSPKNKIINIKIPNENFENYSSNSSFREGSKHRKNINREVENDSEEERISRQTFKYQ